MDASEDMTDRTRDRSHDIQRAVGSGGPGSGGEMPRKKYLPQIAWMDTYLPMASVLSPRAIPLFQEK